MIEAQTKAWPTDKPPGGAEELSRKDGDAANHSADLESLRFYTKTKLALAARLRTLRENFKQRGSEAPLRQCEKLMVKLAEDRFTLAVVGQFNRGKSSLMNAIIGRELLPVGVLPLTSAITILRFGPKERLLIRRQNVDLDVAFPQEFPVERLAEFVTEKENPGNRKRVKTACLELPLPFLRRGLEFVDTPGVGSAIEANTTTTLTFLPECDAVLFVTSVDSPFSRVELEFLESIRQDVRKIFFIVNKTDLLSAGERGEVLDFVRDTIRTHTGTEDVKIFPVSSRLGLAAKLEGDRTACPESGLTELEEALARFLAGEKAAAFLAGIERAMRPLEQEAAGAGLRAEVLPADVRPVAPINADLALNLRTRACPVCDHLREVAFHFFSQFQYDLARDEATQQDFAEVLGFCARHTWQLEAVSSPVGAALGFAKLAGRVSKILAARAESPSAEHTVLNLVRDTMECRVCRLLREAEQDYLRRLAEFVVQPAGRAAYAGSQGVCLRHLGLWLPVLAGAETARFVLEEAARRFEQMAEDMQSFSLKTEALRRGLRNGDERDACWRTIVHLVGTKSNCLPWNKDMAI